MKPFELANAHWVTERLAVGGDLESFEPHVAQSQLDELVGAGITHIIDVRIEWNDELMVKLHHPEVSYFHHGVDDAGQRIPDRWFDKLVAWSNAAYAEPDAKILAHCHMGINRGPSAGFAILLAQGWDPIEAIDAIRQARDIAYIDYADDALAWHLRRQRATRKQIKEALSELAAWRQLNELDVESVIRRMRAAGY